MSKPLEISRRGFIGGVAAAGVVPLLAGKASASSPAPAAATNDAQGVIGSPRFLHTATTTANGWILLCGGYPLNEADRRRFGAHPTASVQLLDPTTGQCYDCAPMNTPRARHSAVLMNDGRVAVAGGLLHHALDSVEIYDPVLNTWSDGAPLPQPLFDHTASFVNDQMILTGGPTGTHFATVRIQPTGNQPRP